MPLFKLQKYFWAIGMVFIAWELIAFSRLYFSPIQDIYLHEVQQGSLSPARFYYSLSKETIKIEEADISFLQSFLGPDLILGNIYPVHILGDEVLFQKGSFKYLAFLLLAMLSCFQLLQRSRVKKD